MALRVSTNLANQQIAGHLSRNGHQISRSMGRLASGARLDSASVDAAGMAVSTLLETQALSYRRAMRNANEGVSMLQVAESSSTQTADILQRMRELAVQAGSETITDTERGFIGAEVDALDGELRRIAEEAEFNGVAIANGSVTELNLQIGIRNTAGSRVSVSLGDLTVTTLGLGDASNSLDVSTVTTARSSLDTLDAALDSVNSYRSKLGAAQNRLDAAVSSMQSAVESTTAADSRIHDVDYATETAYLTRLQLLQSAGIAAATQARGISEGALRLLA